MYDLSKRFCKSDISVEELIEQLCKLPQDATVYICGDNNCYIHIDELDGTVWIDNEALDDCYEDENEDYNYEDDC